MTTPLPVLRAPLQPSAAADDRPFSIALQYARDVKNVLQAQVALRWKRVYLPSLFGHYSVNSACNLRCSYCYVGQPEIFPEGFAQRGLPLDRARRVLRNLRHECVALRIQGGEPLIYRHIAELVRYARRELRFWNVSLITNGLALARSPDRWRGLLDDLHLLTISLDRTRLREYPAQMEELTAFLPALARMARERRCTLTLNYTAPWDELAEPEGIAAAIQPYLRWFSNVYVMPVRQAGKTPLPLLKNSVRLNRRYSWTPASFPDYPEVEHVQWYRDHCDPKLKIKVDPDGGVVYPCENHSYSAGSLEHGSIRELWTGQAVTYPNESCIGCGKQRFRSHAVRHPFGSAGVFRVLTGGGHRGAFPAAAPAQPCAADRPGEPVTIA